MRDRSRGGAFSTAMALLLAAAMACPWLPSSALAEEAEGEAKLPAQELAVEEQVESEAEGAEAEAEGADTEKDEGVAVDAETVPAPETAATETEVQAEIIAEDDGQATSASGEERQVEPDAEDAGQTEASAADEGQYGTDSEDPELTAQGVYIAASGTWGTCPWTLDSSGNMRVGPGEGESMYYSDYPWQKYGNIKRVVFARGTVMPSDCSNLFSDCSHITAIDASGCNTSKVTDMSGMFYECSALATINVSGWDTSAVTDMNYMFCDCCALASVDVSRWDTHSVIYMREMFAGCSGLKSLDVSGWETSSVEDMGGIFSGCSGLKSLDVSGWETSSVTDMERVFSGCSGLKSLDVSGWETSSVEDMGGIFSGCSGLKSLDVSGWETSSVEDMGGIFSGCSGLKSLNVSGWDTSSVYYMGSMFSGCWLLESLNVSGWDTSLVASMSYMFDDCSSLSSLNVSGWDTSSVGRGESWRRDMKCMFRGCSSLSSLDVSGWDTSSVRYMDSMFEGCSGISSLDVSSWETGVVEDMAWMFKNCSRLSKIDVSGWDTSNVRRMRSMFDGCSSLTSFSAPRWDTSEVYDMDWMFSHCSKLATIDLSGWDTLYAAKSMGGMFNDCNGVKKITVGKLFRVDKAFPQGYGSCGSSHGMWKSSSNSTVYTTEKVMSSRKGIADTYYAQGSLKNASIGSVATQPYSGKEVKPALKVTFGNKTLVAGTDYTVTYKNNVKEGQATATIKGKGCFVDSKSTTFTIKRLTPTWSGATRLPVSATADIKVTNGGWIRLKSGGKWVTSDKVLSLSSPSATTKRITAKASGTTTLYLLDATGKQVATKKVTVYAINGKTYEFESSVDKNYVLDIQGGSTKNGAQMIVYKRNNGAHQKYQTYLQKDGTYAIRSLKSKKWLTVEPKTNKYVQQWAWKGDKSQLWKLTVDASNRVTFVNVKTNKCFDVQGGKTKNSAKMIVWQSNGGRNQKWKLNQK